MDDIPFIFIYYFVDADNNGSEDYTWVTVNIGQWYNIRISTILEGSQVYKILSTFPIFENLFGADISETLC